MEKIYYRPTDGLLCNRYPTDIPIEEGYPYIEVEGDVFDETLSVASNCHWGVVDGILQIIKLYDEDDGLSDDEKYDKYIREKMYEKYPQDKQNAILMKALAGDTAEFEEMKVYQETIKKEAETLR